MRVDAMDKIVKMSVRMRNAETFPRNGGWFDVEGGKGVRLPDSVDDGHRSFHGCVPVGGIVNHIRMLLVKILSIISAA